MAFSFFPQMVATYREVVDAQAIRGQELKGPRDYLNLGAVAAFGRHRTRGDDVGAAGIARIWGHSRSAHSAFGRLAPAAGIGGALCGGVSLRGWRDLPSLVAAARRDRDCWPWRCGPSGDGDSGAHVIEPCSWQRTDWVVLGGAVLAMATVFLRGIGCNSL